MTARKALARTTAVLSRIDDALDDPFPAAVARLAGVPGWWFGCHRDEQVTIGATRGTYLWRHYVDTDYDACLPGTRDNVGQGDPARCWADHDDLDPCGRWATTDLGLCAHHHAEIVGVDPTLEVTIGAVPVPCKAFEVEMAPIAEALSEALAPVFTWWRELDDDTRDALVIEMGNDR